VRSLTGKQRPLRLVDTSVGPAGICALSSAEDLSLDSDLSLSIKIGSSVAY
jgi:hypothetical protein